MSQDPQPSHYLDALFVAIRAFAAEMRSARAWFDRARGTKSQPWRLSFFRAARSSHEHAHAHLRDVEQRLALLATAGKVPPPLDRIASNLVAMRSDLDELAASLRGEEAEAARVSAPIGRA
jgi:hypothetical protein